MMDFTQKLLLWYRDNKRDLPWRNTNNPYYIWLSEIILQQTRIEQGLPYYNAFINAFPTIEHLAKAHENTVLNLWQGLGYYSRARNLHATAKLIHSDLNNQFPAQYTNIISLKGIGPYTAAAIASFAFKEPIGVVDGNVFRVISRFYGIYDDISLGKTRTIFQNLVNELIDKKHPDLFNHAIMDFGATVCTPKKPMCNTCIFQDKCVANLKNEQDILPVKNKKITIKKRYFQFLLSENKGKIIIEQRKEKDIWQQLYQLPLLETSNNDPNIIEENLLKTHKDLQFTPFNNEPIIHKLSHQHLEITFFKAINLKPNTQQIEVNISDLYNYGFPIVIWNFLKAHYQLD